MALLVTIGNICILGNFQLGIWGWSIKKLDRTNSIRYNHKLTKEMKKKLTNLTLLFGNVNVRQLIEF